MREQYYCTNRDTTGFFLFYTVDLFLDLELSCRGKSKELSGISLVVVAVTTGCEDWLQDESDRRS